MRGREPNRVLEQVRHHLVDQDRIHRNVGGITEDRPDPDPAERRFEAVQDGLDDLVQRRGLLHWFERSRAHLRQAQDVADQPVEPVGLLEDRLQELSHLARVEPDVCLQQAAHRGLDRCQRRAEIVGHRGEQRRARLAPLHVQPGGGDLRIEASALQVDRDLARSGLDQPAILRDELLGSGARGREGSELDLAAPDRHFDRRARDRVGSPPPDVVRAAGRRGDDRATGQAKRIDQRGREVVQHPFERLAGQRLGREQVEQARLAFATGRAVAFGHGAGHHPSDEQRDHQEDHERHHVVAVVDAQGVERLGEEVVDGQEPEQRAPDPRPDPSDDGGDHHGQQEDGDGAELSLGLGE